MARRRPNPDDVLSARGYNAQVLWPRYEPGGGVNSGSEPPVRPSNTLQSNQSNLVLTRYNPLDSNYDDLVELRPVTGNTSAYYRLTRNPTEDELLLQHLAEMEREEEERGKKAVKAAPPRQMTREDRMRTAWEAVRRKNPKREVGDSMQARRKSKSCSGAQINPGDSITKTEAGWERTDLL